MTGAVIYTQRKKALHFTEAMLAGFPAREVSAEAARMIEDADQHILGGLQFGCLEVMQQIRAARKELRMVDERFVPDFIFWDNAYLGGGTATDRLRITRASYQQVALQRGRTLERFERFGGRIRPWRKSGEHILVVPPSPAVEAMFGYSGWLENVLERLARVTDREIDVSRKGDPRPLEARLANCHCVMTWTSNVAVLAVLAGVPAFVYFESAAWLMSNSVANLETKLEQPRMLEREEWAASLAWGQFTTDEIRSGFARAVVMGEA